MGINPVWYLERNSGAFRTIASSIGVQWRQYDPEAKALKLTSVTTHVLYESMKLLCFCKVSEGPVWDKKADRFEATQQVRYYDEREWRYVPFDTRLPDKTMVPLFWHPVYAEQKFGELEDVAKANEALKAKPLAFTGADIRHILVDDELQRDALLQGEGWKTLFASRDELLARIRVYDHIQQDF
jgi:hypothetical protein